MSDHHCPICIETIDSTSTLDCGHLFHSRCILTWKSAGGNTCPVCRREMRMESENKKLRAELARAVAYSNARDDEIMKMTQTTRDVEIENIRLLMQLGNMQFKARKQEEKKVKYEIVSDTVVAAIGILLIVLTLLMNVRCSPLSC